MYYVDGVKENSLAKKAGILPGDVITHINGEEVTDGLMYGFLTCNECVEISFYTPARIRRKANQTPWQRRCKR